ncbi:hypothetical protein BDD12DRAFT_901044 [Trichophaea hybrida]|nr:hypothetical protein BDD12DRAFT_901044 [Trichophaea hybrida]
MSADAERVFSSTGKQLSDRRRKLGDDIVEAQEILKSLMRNGLLQFEQAVSIIRLLDAVAKLENAKD